MAVNLVVLVTFSLTLLLGFCDENHKEIFPQVVYLGHADGKVFFLDHSLDDWDSAHWHCNASRMQLATVTTILQFEALRTGLAALDDENGYWVDAKEVSSVSRFQWVAEENPYLDSNYIALGSEAPSNNCLYIRQENTQLHFHPFPCEYFSFELCELRPSKVVDIPYKVGDKISVDKVLRHLNIK